MNKLLTPEYEAQLREKHATKAWGGGGASWVPELVRLVMLYQGDMRRNGHIKVASPSILDYGAGRRTFVAAMKWLVPNSIVHEYDPGVPAISALPTGPYDFTLCTDVMEHVEEQFVDETLMRIADLTLYAVFFNIALSPSKSLLPNGQNAHLTVKPLSWWNRKLADVFQELELVSNHKGYTVVAHKQARKRK